MFCWRKNIICVWTYKTSKWWQDFAFMVNCPFKNQLKISNLVLLTGGALEVQLDAWDAYGSFVDLDYGGCSHTEKHSLMSIVSAELACYSSIPGNNWAFLITERSSGHCQREPLYSTSQNSKRSDFILGDVRAAWFPVKPWRHLIS